jgi:hypothetical protein
MRDPPAAGGLSAPPGLDVVRAGRMALTARKRAPSKHQRIAAAAPMLDGLHSHFSLRRRRHPSKPS